MGPGFLSKEYWDTRWRENQTGWDLGVVSPPLKHYIDSLSDKAISILIPGCGNAWEAEYLLQQGFQDITLIDISPKAVEILQNRFSGNKSVNPICGDFFQLEGKFDLILEQTFFCALSPNLRKDYAMKMSQLLKDNGLISGLLFDIEFGFEGPPFGGNSADYQKIFSSSFEIKSWEKSILSHPQRLGNEVFIELLVRK
jgi:SAM-dependent methyltransferase